MELTGAQILMKVFEEEGVDTVFGGVCYWPVGHPRGSERTKIRLTMKFSKFDYTKQLFF